MGSSVARNKVILVRVAPAEDASVDLAAAARRMKKATFARMATLSAAEEIPCLEAKELAALQRLRDDLRLAGINLHAVVRDIDCLRLGHLPVEPVTVDRVTATVAAVGDRVSAIEEALAALVRIGLRLARLAPRGRSAR